MRLVAVLGYSHPRWHEIHDICAERVHHAETLQADAVLLSGEVDHMRPVWNGRTVQLLLDPDARSTRENALGVADAAHQVGADEVVVVTSKWHAFRARTLVRTVLPGVAVTSSSPPGRPPVALLGREAVCLAALPIQLLRVRLRR
jgi:uncharacterized SAM-binding protein YcdF (DUF218 family)